MLYHKAISAEPVRYTAATLEIMRLDGLSHLRCAVNYANDHSAGHLSNTTKAANGYWASKELALREEKREKFKNRELPSEVRAKLERKEARRVRRALRAPYAVGEDGDNAFYSHKETSNFAFVNPKGKRRVELTGLRVILPFWLTVFLQFSFHLSRRPRRRLFSRRPQEHRSAERHQLRPSRAKEETRLLQLVFAETSDGEGCREDIWAGDKARAGHEFFDKTEVGGGFWSSSRGDSGDQS